MGKLVQNKNNNGNVWWSIECDKLNLKIDLIVLSEHCCNEIVYLLDN